MASTVRFLRQYLRPRPDAVEASDVVFERDGGERMDAGLYRPTDRRGPLPGWVLLHGLTTPGRHHDSLVRFARAIAASGAVVLVPDIPEWRRLRIASAVTVPTIRSAALALDARDDTRTGRTGVMGFSFGATQALVASVDPRLEGRLAAVAAWGGYCDPHRIFRFGITGEHELDDVRYRSDPDPYGRWIIAGNNLPLVAGHEGDHVVAEALLHLAREAGRRRIYAADPVYDPIKAELRAEMSTRQRDVFDLLAPPTTAPAADRRAATEFAKVLADAAVENDPLLDPGPFLSDIPVRTLVAHGRDDRLIPFTEALRLERALPPSRCAHCAVTSLFAHSGGTRPDLGPFGIARETTRFLRVLNRILDLV